MNIKTKFDIGSKVFFMHSNKVATGCVTKISVTVIEKKKNDPDVIVTMYQVKPNIPLDRCPCVLSMHEVEIFGTKEELLKTL